MEEVQEVKRLVKQLHESSSPKETLDILKVMKTSVNASEKLLRDTKAGVAVGKLRDHSDPLVQALARELVDKWKRDVKASKNHTVSAAVTTTNSPATAAAGAAQSPKVVTPPQPISAPAAPPPPRTGAAAAIAALSPTTATSATSNGPPRTFKTDGITFSTTGDKTRDKCTEMVYDALAWDSGAPGEQIKQRAVSIEKTAYLDHDGNSSGPYRAKMRSLFLNLKDKANPALRLGVISGELSVAKLCKMAPSEMASEQRKEADRLLQEENLFKSYGAKEPEAETTAFVCARCKSNKTRYRQAQTRSADEPMTTFVTCVNCGNRWKFS